MAFSWSQIAAPAADTPKVISIASTPGPSAPSSRNGTTVATDDAAAPQPDAEASSAPPVSAASTASTPIATSSDEARDSLQPEAGPSRPAAPRLKHLILDAGPLLSLTPLRHLAEEYHTTPAVVAELRDPKAREYWERLGLQGVDVKVEQPSPESMARVMAFARKTGDYAVLSQTDMGVVALALQYEVRENGETNVRKEPGEKKAPRVAPAAQGGSGLAEAIKEESAEAQSAEAPKETEGQAEAVNDAEEVEEVEGASSSDSDEGAEQEATPISESAQLAESLEATHIDESAPVPSASEKTAEPEEESDPESDGEWITPSNLTKHRSKDLGLLPTTSPNAHQAQLAAAAMTGDFAVQNVLLAMGLGLVGEGGKRISKVKSWVLRCHACFKICRDPSKRFCPSCGGPTLMRTNVTTTANGKMHLHLKSNYQYNLRGTKFTIPDAKPGRAKGQIKAGTGLILREDQREWQDAVRLEEGRRRKEEKKARNGNWDDPDWLPEILTVGASGKGRSGGQGMPTIGHGRKNPNVARRKR